MKRVLIVDDDKNLRDTLNRNLSQLGYEVLATTDGSHGMMIAQSGAVDILVLNLSPLRDCVLEMCQRLRSDPRTRDLLIMMLSSNSSEDDELHSFQIGADDYVTKPCSLHVLLERIKALSRRGSLPKMSSERVMCHGLTVDSSHHRALAGDRVLDLTTTEFKLLETFVRTPGRAFTRRDLIATALGVVNVTERTIDVHIRALRVKLDSYADLIETVRGIGYRFRGVWSN